MEPIVNEENTPKEAAPKRKRAPAKKKQPETFVRAGKTFFIATCANKLLEKRIWSRKSPLESFSNLPIAARYFMDKGRDDIVSDLALQYEQPEVPVARALEYLAKEGYHQFMEGNGHWDIHTEDCGQTPEDWKKYLRQEAARVKKAKARKALFGVTLDQGVYVLLPGPLRTSNVRKVDGPAALKKLFGILRQQEKDGNGVAAIKSLVDVKRGFQMSVVTGALNKKENLLAALLTRDLFPAILGPAIITTTKKLVLKER